MKKLVTGNFALARGLWEAGGKFIAAYPGTPSTEITEFAAEYDEIRAEWSPNEKVAFEAALGAAMGGVRSLVAMKMVGLNVAADPLFTAAYTGAKGGLVVVSADDPGVHSSQNEQDNRHYAKAAKIPMLEPSDSQEVLEFTKYAFELSEQFDIPVLLRLTTRICHGQSLVELGDRQQVADKRYEVDFDKYVMIADKARRRHALLEQKVVDLGKVSEDCGLNRVEMNDSEIGVICAGACYQYVKEALPEASILKIGMSYPLPKQMITNFASQVRKLYIIEELDPFIEDIVKSWGIKCTGKELFSFGGEIFREDIEEKILEYPPAKPVLDVSIPPRPPLLCPGCSHRGVFYVFNKLKLDVSGDIGCYTLGHQSPFRALHCAICMGASIGISHGLSRAIGDDFSKRAVAVIGESTFIHSGITSLINIVYNQSNTKVVILDNSITAMTGHQPNPSSGFNAKGEIAPTLDLVEVCKACGISKVIVADSFDLKGFETTMREVLDFAGPAVVIVKRPCALLDRGVKKSLPHVDEKSCIGCGACFKVGCPGLGRKQTDTGKVKAFIYKTLCNSCGLCAQVCPQGAIKNKKEEQ
ncbi:MAG: indolepyruvate ferredoxin oxidoreductase subunit alpha [Bacillota bacterium]|jgi:indolepyruvate ferredoxin oxidoreductase alpha subunit